MAKSKHPRTAQRKPNPALTPIRHDPRRGHVVAMQGQKFPATVDDKIVCAKSIVQAVVAAHDAETLSGENYDIHWPLSLVIELLEQASEQTGDAE